MRYLIFGLALLAAPAMAQAQDTEVTIPTHYFFTIHPASDPGSVPVVRSVMIDKATQIVCNLDPIPAPTTVVANPKIFRWTDPERPTRDCAWDSRNTAPGQPIFAWPTTGIYVARAVAARMEGSTLMEAAISEASSPFVFGRAPATVVDLRVTGGS